MKIGELTGQALDLPEPKKKVKDRDQVGASKPGAPASRAAPAAGFAQAFLGASQATLSRALDAIMEDLGRQGEKLAGSQNFEELEKYRGLVKEFLGKATQGIAKLRFTDGGARAGKVHVLLQKVDAHMEALTREVLGKQAAPLAILARLDQIRGMLLDLYK